MSTPQFRLGFERKIGYSFIGLFAGNLVSVSSFLVNVAVPIFPDVFTPSVSLRDRLLHVLGLTALFGIVSLVSWVVIGLPVVFFLSARLTARLHWSLAALIGAILGATALALLYTSLDGWRRTLADFKTPEVLRTDITFLAVAVVIAGVAFSVYCALVRQALRRAQIENGAPYGAPQFFSIF